MMPGSLHIGVASNVHLDVIRRTAGGVWSVERHRTHNLITTAGLTAWVYNLPNSDGQVINRIVIGDDDAAPALGDTALGNQLVGGSFTSINTTVVGPTAIITAWIIGTSRDDLDGDTLKEIGIFTAASGATPSSNKLIARAVVPAIDLTDDMICHVVWNLTVAPVDTTTTLPTESSVRWTDWGKNYIATRLINLSTFGVLDKAAFGTSTVIINPREVEALSTETHRETPSSAWSAAAAVVSCSGTVASGTTGTIQEMGAAVGAVADLKTIYQAIHNQLVICGNTLNNCDYSASMTFANV